MVAHFLSVWENGTLQEDPDDNDDDDDDADTEGKQWSKI